MRGQRETRGLLFPQRREQLAPQAGRRGKNHAEHRRGDDRADLSGEGTYGKHRGLQPGCWVHGDERGEHAGGQAICQRRQVLRERETEQGGSVESHGPEQGELAARFSHVPPDDHGGSDEQLTMNPAE